MLGITSFFHYILSIFFSTQYHWWKSKSQFISQSFVFDGLPLNCPRAPSFGSEPEGNTDNISQPSLPTEGLHILQNPEAFALCSHTLKFLDDLIWYWLVFIHCAGFSIDSFNLATYDNSFEKWPQIILLLIQFPFSFLYFRNIHIWLPIFPGWMFNFLTFPFLFLSLKKCIF